MRHSYRIAGVNKTFEQAGVQVLHDVSLDVPHGSIVSLIGPSGCGKSTLLNIMGGLLTQSSGTVEIFGKQVDGPPREVGIMFQKATLLPWRTVVENILLPIEIQHGKKAARAARPQAEQLLRMAELTGAEDQYPDELSGGMAQRAAICRMLITEPEVLLLDEPFGALDELTREKMDLEIQRVAADRGATVVIVTHSIPEAVLLSDTVYAMATKPGRISEVIDIDLPRPRDLSVMEDPAFGRYTTQVRRALDRGHDRFHAEVRPQ
jgi:NitT/TauT family transport system ATP-binding protein